ncbi:hypothetical protein [Streptomyces cinereoruber]|uniref:hypothetical protein n=1 Tax=Streptomyces cinereoruber TaxID=67260 RepID=UPI003638FC19
MDDAVEAGVSKVHVGSGTHGTSTGEWVGTNPELAESRFITQDQELVEIYGRDNITVEVYNMADPAAREAFFTLQSTSPDELFIKAWCYSATCRP